MSIANSVAGSSLILSWALILSARTVAASIYGSQPGASYPAGTYQIGMLLPAAAWLSLVAGIFILCKSALSVGEATPAE